MEIQVIALNQQSGFAGNRLFKQETSLLKELVAECVKSFITEMSSLETGEIITTLGLDLTSAQYIQELEIKNWSGLQVTMNLLQFAVRTTPSSSTKANSGRITPAPIISTIFCFLVLNVIIKRRKEKKKRLTRD